MASEVSVMKLGSPMRTFWITVLTSALVLFLAALLFGRYGVESPLSSPTANKSEIWSVNVAIWSLAISAVVSIAGSITAIAIAGAAKESQQESERLQAINVYHNDPAYQKSLRVSGAYLSARSTLQLILTGLGESRTHAISHGTPNPMPMVLGWRVFSRDLHKSLVESDLYDYLLESNHEKEMIAWSVGILLTTAEELDAIIQATSQPDASSEGIAPSDVHKQVFRRNALAYLAAGQLFDFMRHAPAIETLYKMFGGQALPPYIRSDRPDVGSVTAASRQAIRSLAQESIQRFQRNTGIAVFTSRDAAETISDSLRYYFQAASEADLDVENFTPIVLIDFALPFASKTLQDAMKGALLAGRHANGGQNVPGVAKRIVELQDIEASFEYISATADAVSNDLAMTLGSAIRSMPPLLPLENPSINLATRAMLDKLAELLKAKNQDALFVFHIRNEMNQAETCYLASRVPRSVVVWHGWPLIPNEGVAFQTLFEEGRFARAGISSDSFPFTAPVVFVGGLSFSVEEGEWASNLAAEKLRTLCKFIAVSDIASVRWANT